MSLRYLKNRDTGTYSLQVRRPRIYRIKICIHMFILFVLLVMFILYAVPKTRSAYDDVRMVVTAVQFIVWLFSALMLRFEYRRAIGHIWYMHPLFIWLSFVIYLVDLVYTIVLKNSVDIGHTRLVTSLIIIDSIILVCSLVLGILVVAYPEDTPKERRNYFDADAHMRMALMTGEESGRAQSRPSSLYESQDG